MPKSKITGRYHLIRNSTAPLGLPVCKQYQQATTNRAVGTKHFLTIRYFQARLQALIASADNAINQASNYLISQGEVIDLTEWVAIKRYCEMFGIANTETVSNWIRRGIVPAADTQVIEEFNNIRMIRAKPYNVRSAENVG